MTFTKIVGAGIHTLSNVNTHNVNSSGIITATKFVGPFDGSSGDFSGNVTVGGNLVVNGDFTTLNTTLREVEILRVDANSSEPAGIITQTGAGDILKLYDGASQVVTVDDTGKVGLGTDAPDTLLHLHSSSPVLQIEDVTGTQNQLTRLLQVGAGFRVQLRNNNNDGTLTVQGYGNAQAKTFIRVENDGNVGIGTDDPAVQLHIQSNSPVIRLTDDNQAADNRNWNITAGNTQILRIQALNDAGSGGGRLFDFYRSGSNVEEFRGMKSGNAWFTINNNNEKVGIGTDNPDELLELAGADPVLKLHDSSGGSTHGLKVNHDGVNATIDLESAGLLSIKQTNGNAAGNGIAFNTGTVDTEKLRITGDGNVGIGTDDPSNKLEVHVGASSVKIKGDDDGSFHINPNSSGGGQETLIGQANGDLRLQAGAATYHANWANILLKNSNKHIIMNAGNSGNVGIGSASPTSRLDVVGGVIVTGTSKLSGDVTINRTTALLGSKVSITKDADQEGIGIQLNQNSGITTSFTTFNSAGSQIFSLAHVTDTTPDLILKLKHSSDSAPVEKLRITSVGRVGIGTNPEFKLDVLGNTRINRLSDGGALVLQTSANDAADIHLNFKKARGGTTLSVVQDGDDLATINAQGYSAAAGDFRTAASINFQVDGEPDSSGDATDMPGRILFETSPNGSATPAERLRIASDGKIKFATSNSTTDYFEWGGNPRLYLKVPSGTNGLRIDSDTTPLEIRNSSANGRTLAFGSGGATNFDMILSGDYSLSSSGYDSTPKIFFNTTRHNGSTTVTSFQCSIQGVAASNTSNDGYLGLGASASPDDLVILTSGNIGIGSTNPSEKLDVKGHLAVGEDFAVNRARIILSAPNVSGGPYDHLFGANLKVDSSGTFTTPSENISGGGWLYLAANSLNAHGHMTYMSAPDTNGASSTPLERLRIDALGRVLIGDDTTPNAVASVAVVGSYGASSNLTPFVYLCRDEDATSITNNESLGQILFASKNGYRGAVIEAKAAGTWSGSSSDGYLTFKTTPDNTTVPVERLRITSGGNVGIGTDDPTKKLEVLSPDLVGSTENNRAYSARFTTKNPTSFLNLDVYDRRWENGQTHAWQGTEKRIEYNVNDNTSKRMWMSFFNPSSTTTSNVIRFGEQEDSEWMRIEDGLVGIGTNNPDGTPLYVRGTDASALILERTNTNNCVMRFRNNTSSMFAGLAGNALGFAIDDDEDLGNSPMMIVRRDTGRLGVGVGDSPGYKLHVKEASVNTIATFESGDGGAGILLKDDTHHTRIETTDGAFKIDVDVSDEITAANRSLSFQINASTKLSIQNSGQLNLAGNFQFTAANPELEFNNGGPRFRVPAANTLAVHSGGTLGSTNNEQLRITSGVVQLNAASNTHIRGGVYAKYTGASGNTANINVASASKISWLQTNTEIFENGGFTNTDTDVTVPFDGIYQVTFNGFVSGTGGGQRTNIRFRYRINGTDSDVDQSLNNYIRTYASHNESSVNFTAYLNLTAGQTVSISALGETTVTTDVVLVKDKSSLFFHLVA